MAKSFVTIEHLVTGLRQLGIGAGDVVIVHCSLSAFGYVVGGPQAVLEALVDVLTPAGTLVMPAHTPENSDPDAFEYPPLPRRHRSTWRQHYPAFDPFSTPCPYMGVVAEAFRGWPASRRSGHPTYSFCAWGRHAARVVADHRLESGLGRQSPLERVCELDGEVLCLGTSYDTNTSFHLGEARAGIPKPRMNEAAMLVEGRRTWVRYRDYDWDNHLFESIGEAFERAHGVRKAMIGDAVVRRFSQRAAVQFAEGWFLEHAKTQPTPAPLSPRFIEWAKGRLRPPRLEDSTWLSQALGDRQTAHFLCEAFPSSVDDAEDFLCDQLYRIGGGGGDARWIIEDEQGEPSGFLRLDRRGHEAEVSIAMMHAKRRRGLASIALRLVVPVALRSERCFRVVGMTDLDDEAGIRTLEASGFTREGILRRHARRVGYSEHPYPRDSILYSVTI